MEVAHVHGVDGGEHVGGALHHALAGLGHGDGSAASQEHGLLAGAQRGKEVEEVALHQHHLSAKIRVTVRPSEV